MNTFDFFPMNKETVQDGQGSIGELLLRLEGPERARLHLLRTYEVVMEPCEEVMASSFGINSLIRMPHLPHSVTTEKIDGKEDPEREAINLLVYTRISEEGFAAHLDLALGIANSLGEDTVGTGRANHFSDVLLKFGERPNKSFGYTSGLIYYDQEAVWAKTVHDQVVMPDALSPGTLDLNNRKWQSVVVGPRFVLAFAEDCVGVQLERGHCEVPL